MAGRALEGASWANLGPAPAVPEEALSIEWSGVAPETVPRAAPAAPVGLPRVEELRSRAAWLAIRPEWEELVDRTRAEPFLGWDFLTIWLEHFAAGDSPRILTVREPDGRLVAGLALVERRSVVGGVPLRELRSASNAHSCRFDLLAEQPEAVAPRLLAHLLRDPHWDLLRLLDVPEGGAGWALVDAARRLGLRVHTWQSQRSPWFWLEEAVPGGHFRANLRRRRRRLAERGPVRFVRWTGGTDLESRLERFFALEASGWKGARGTAIARDPRLRGFYRELARASMARHSLVLSTLELDGRPIAGHYALEHRGRYLLLKPAYDEAFGPSAPGQLLIEDTVADGHDRGVQLFDFLGPDMPWKRDWTRRVRVHTWLGMYRDTPRGRLAWTMKARWLPWLRAEVGRWRR